MSDAEYIGVLEAGREADKLVIAKLEAKNKALREAVDEVLNASVSSLEYRSNRLQLAMWGLRAVRDKALLKQGGE